MHRLLSILLLVSAISLLVVGCSEKDVPYVVDEDELTRYLTETADGKELFAVNGVISSDPYGFPFDDGVYVDSVIDHERSYNYLIAGTKESDLADYGYLGLLREAAVYVTDEYTIQTTKTFPGTTDVDTTVRSLTRMGFFLKLGSDAEDYVGWLLWGFSGIDGAAPTAVARVERFDNSFFSGDLSAYTDHAKRIPVDEFRRVANLDTVVVGSRLVLKLTQASSTVHPAVYVLSGTDTSGVFQREMHVADTLSFDTIRTVKVNPPYYEMLYIHEFNNSQFTYRRSWCIPYRH